MKPEEILSQARDEVLEEVFAALQHTSPTHCEHEGETLTRARLGEPFDLVVATIASRELAPLSTRVEAIATGRFSSGFDISEVQSAFNALELAPWRRLVAATPPEDLAESIRKEINDQIRSRHGDIPPR